MARYKMIINTDTYKCKRCSKKNWEPGTLNDLLYKEQDSLKTELQQRGYMEEYL